MNEWRGRVATRYTVRLKTMITVWFNLFENRGFVSTGPATGWLPPRETPARQSDALDDISKITNFYHQKGYTGWYFTSCLIGFEVTSGEVFVDSDLELEEAAVTGQLGTVWSDSSRMGGGRRLWTTKLIAPQSDTFGDWDLFRPNPCESEFGVVLCRFVFEPSDEDVWL